MPVRTLPFAVVLLLAALSGCVHRVAEAPPGPALVTPEGMVEVSVVSDDEGRAWSAYLGGEDGCTTPCRKVVGQWDALLLRSRRGDEVLVPGIGSELPGVRRVLVVPERERSGEQVLGIVSTMLGGMGLVAGIVLTAVGCSDIEKRGGACTAGLITGGTTAALLTAGILMIVDSAPRAHVLPVVTVGPEKAPAATLVVTPTGVAGTF